MRSVRPWSRKLVVKILKKYGIRPRKSLGQSFLVSYRYARLIVNALELTESDFIYEIGAGLGALTVLVAQEGIPVVAVEIDLALGRALMDLIKHYANVYVVIADALTLEVPWQITKVLSNVPYSISSPLLTRLLRAPKYELAVLTLQKEFAERLFARPGTKKYGRLTILASLTCTVEKVGLIPRWAFYPEPDVDSLIIRIRPKPRVDPHVIPRVEMLTRRIFPYRRKVLSKALKIAGLTLDPSVKTEISDILRKRVFELTPSDVVRLAASLYDVCKDTCNSAHKPDT